MADGEIIISKLEKIVTENPARKVICVVDLHADDDLQADAHSFDPQLKFYHPLFKIVKMADKKINKAPMCEMVGRSWRFDIQSSTMGSFHNGKRLFL